MNKISAIIVANGNPPHLRKTLESLDFVDEIVIVDIGIHDACIKMIEKWPKVVIKTVHENVLYVEQIREKSKMYASHNKILFLDPDEVVTPGLKNELVNNMNKFDFMSMPRKNMIFGKWIQHSRWWPDYQIRFFDKKAVFWPARLHAQPETTGTGYTIEPVEQKALLHFNYDSRSDYLTKMMRYAQAEAGELVATTKIYTIGIAISEALQEFISRFFAEKGYRDGMHGLVLALLQMMYKFLVYFYYWELKNYTHNTDKEVTSAPTQFFMQGLYQVNYWLIHEKLISTAKQLKYKIINRLIMNE